MNTAPRTIVITGAASGIGHAFTLHYASASPSSLILALDIAQDPPSSLHSHKNIHYHCCDVTDPSAVVRILAAQLGDPTDAAGCKPVHMLIHSAGVRGLVPAIEGRMPEEVAGAETWGVMDKSTLMRTFEINAVGTFTVVRACLPYLLAVSLNNPANDRPKVIVMGSRMGSMSYNSIGGGYAYRASKAALNAMIKSFAIDVPEVVFVVVHPGRVETGLVKVREEGAMSVEESLKDMVGLIERLGGADSGRFVDRFGRDIGW